MRFLWFRCDVIITSSALGVLVIAIALGGFFLKREIDPLEGAETHCSMADQARANIENYKTQEHSAFVLGYTGELGRALVAELNKQKIFKRIVLIGRRQVPLDVGPEFEQKVVDFENIDDHRNVFKGLDVGFCCLGTTRSKSGTEGFIRVDHDYVLLSAEVAKSQSCKHFLLVSSQGADKNSSFLYPRTKGQVEEAMKVMHFHRLSVFRPGILLCDRQESRPVEAALRSFLKPVAYFFPTAMSSPVEVVAKAMINNVLSVPGEDVKEELLNNKAIHLLSGTAKVCGMPRSASAPESTKTK